uniref:hypothetical protein n=1 Tax=Nocardia suismassiliense TaxID=2077092 RepID=UPI003F499080
MAPRQNTATNRGKKAKVKDGFIRAIGAADGETVEVVLPSLTYLKPGLARRLRGMGDRNAMWFIIEESLTAEALAALDEMDPDEFETLLVDWGTHSGINLGES